MSQNPPDIHVSHPVFSPGEQVTIGLALEKGEGEKSIQGNIGITKQHWKQTGEISLALSGGYKKERSQGGQKNTKNIGLGITNSFQTPRIQGFTNFNITSSEKTIFQDKLIKTEQYKKIQSLCLQLNTELQGKTKGGLYYQLNTKYELNKKTGSSTSHKLTVGGIAKGNISKPGGMKRFLSGNMTLDSEKKNATQYTIKTGLEQKLKGNTKALFGIEYNSTTKIFTPLIKIGLKKVF